MSGKSTRPHISRHGKTITSLLWVVSISVAAILVWHRDAAAIHGTLGTDYLGTDFLTFLQAARLVADGRSPYLVGQFVYPPPLVLLLAPFSHSAPVHLWKVWTALEIGALMVGVVAFTAVEARQLKSWKWPILFAFCSITVMYFWPVTYGLSLGQSDALVFAVLMLSALVSIRGRMQSRGVLIGVAGLIKVWPAATALSLLQRGVERRRHAVVTFLLTILLAPILAAVFWGGSGVAGFFKNVFDARSQRLVNDSVWGVPKLLFTNSRLAHPLVVSTSLLGLCTVVLLVWVVGLLAIALSTPGDQVLCLWNVTLCIVLVLPVSHLAYTLYALPILWVWSSRVLRRVPQHLASIEIGVTVVLVLWWVVLTKSWPTLGAPAISSVRYSVVFTANLIACTTSVLGAAYTELLPILEPSRSVAL